MMLAYHFAHAKKFCRMFWAWNVGQQNLFRSCRIPSKSSGEWIIAHELVNEVDDDPELLKQVITGDETLVYGYDVETKGQSS